MIDARIRRRQRTRNVLQGLLLLAGMVVIFGFLSWLLFGWRGTLVIVLLGLVVGAVRPKVPASWMLRMQGASELPRQAAPELHAYVNELSRRAGLAKPPTLFYLHVRMPNAFTTGPKDDAVIVVTGGLLQLLTRREVIAVLAHEISHIRAGDVKIMNVSDSMSRLTRTISWLGLGVVFFTLPLTLAGDLRPLVIGIALMALPTLTTLMQLALSRSREYDADLGGVELTGDPEGLASALEALERSSGSVWERMFAPRQEASTDLALLRSHPPTAERTRRLRELAGDVQPLDGQPGDGTIQGPVW